MRFFVLACLVALQNKVKANLEKKWKKMFRYRQDAAKVALHVQAKESAEVISQKSEPHHEETNVKRRGGGINAGITFDCSRSCVCK